LRIVGKKLLSYQEIGSTSDEAKRMIAKGASEGLVVVADSQTNGRGKPGNSWFSPLGLGLYLSAVIKPLRSPSDLGLITMVGAEAVVDVIKELTGLTPTIKKPNDVLMNGKKVAGILTERLADGHLIIGIGVNVNQQPAVFPADISATATSLLIETGDNLAIGTVQACLLAHLDDKYLEYLARI